MKYRKIIELSQHNKKTNFKEMKITFSGVKSTPPAAVFKSVTHQATK